MSGILVAFGAITWGVAAAVLYLAFRMEITVEVGDFTTANLQLMHSQLILFLLGAFIFLNGTIFIIAGIVLGRARGGH